MTIFLLFISLFFLIFSLKKTINGYIYYVTLLLISIYCFLISLGSLNLLFYDFANYWSNNGIVLNGEISSFYALLILIIYASLFLISETIFKKKKLDIFGFNEILNKNVLNKIYYFSILISILIFVHVFCMNWSILWSNSTYLLIGSLDSLIYTNIYTKMIHMLYPLLGLIACMIFIISYLYKDYKTLFIICLPTIFSILLKIAEHSRYSSLYIAAMILCVLFFSKNKYQKIFISVFLSIIFLFNLMNSLVGRMNNDHGFYSLRKYFDYIYISFENGDLENTFMNIFEGVFVYGESFSYFWHEYPFIYKILSLSPLPSFIDGYSEKASYYTFMLNPYVPMGAVGEIIIFGLPYMIYYIFIISLSIILNFLCLKKNMIFAFTFGLLLIVLASYLQFTYPIRNIFRFFYLSIFISIFFLYIRRMRWGVNR